MMNVKGEKNACLLFLNYMLPARVQYKTLSVL